MKDESEATVPWFDLGRFGASLQVVPNSPLRGVMMTCLDVNDEKVFGRWVAASAAATNASQGRAYIDVWWSNARRLGFGEAWSVYADPTETRGRSSRLYSERTSFTLSELQGIVPGLTAADYKPMPVAQIVQQVQDSPVREEWRSFAETVLARDVISVWVPRANPFAVPFSNARTIEALWDEVRQAPFLEERPVTSWLISELDRARYRENALVPFYVHRDAAVADGLRLEDIELCDMPYALPLWVDRGGRVVALRDVRHAPEIMVHPPRAYVPSVGPGQSGSVVAMLRAAGFVALVYKRALAAWSKWQVAGVPSDANELGDSLHRAIGADVAMCGRFRAVTRDGLWALLVGAGAGAEGLAGAKVKPIEEWRQSEFSALSARVALFVDATTASEVAAVLEGLDKGMRKQAAAASRAALQHVAASIQGGSKAPAPSKPRHEDAGVKVGGARKDWARRAMSLADLDEMTPYELKTLVVKKNIWPPLDYAAMKAAGVEPDAAMAIKWVKDHLHTAPVCLHLETSVSEYVTAVAAIRDAMADVKTLRDFVEAASALCKVGRVDAYGVDTDMTYGGTPMQIQWGREVCQALEVASRSVVAHEIRRAISKWVREGREWDHLIKPRQGDEASKEHDDDDADHEKELHRPHLDRVERLGGQDWRGGRDVVAQDLIDHFGFRAVEFGNWLPNDERQVVLNMAFDSLCDLADGLSLPPRGISFGGTLALAFGSRGRGGKRAALAHFEPTRFVINLTRLKGAGTLAHEWFHALDFHLGARAGFRSNKPVARFAGDPVPALVDSMMRRASTVEEAEREFRLGAERAERNAVGWCYGQSAGAREVIAAKVRELASNTRAAMYGAAIRYFGQEAADREVAGEKSPWARPSDVSAEGAWVGLSHYDLTASVLEAMQGACDNRRAFGKVRDKVKANVHWMLVWLARLATVDAARDLGAPLGDRFLHGANACETDYLKSARALDVKRSKPYWATVIELFARAGAQYVHYELAGKGVRSDYLVYGSEEDRYATNKLGNPNPGHADRMRVGQHFAALIDEFRIACVREEAAEVVAQP